MDSQFFIKIINLIKSQNIKISSHGYEELAEDHIFIRDILNSVETAEVIEDYPEFGKGPCVLVLHKDRDALPLHVVWGIPKGYDCPAVLITAYRPEPAKWSNDFKRRNV